MRDRVFERFREVFADIMDVDDANIDDATTAEDFEEWDSLTHVRLVVALEREFSIKFTNAEIESFDCVGDLINAVVTKTQ